MKKIPLLRKSTIQAFLRPSQANWSWFLLIATILLLLPLLSLLRYLFVGGGDTWNHLLKTVLPRYSVNTLILAVGVLSLSAVMGTFLAWMMARYHFLGKKIFELLLLLPLALPPYISAYAWAGIFGHGMPLRRFLLLFFSPEKVSGLSITNIWGAIVILSFSFYPYIYLILRSSMTRDILPQLEAARNLGADSKALFFRMALPLARPTLVAGLGLVLMEVLNEYGAVSYFGVDTLSTGIFRAWFNFYDLGAARRLGGILLLIVFILLILEAFQRRRKRFHLTQDRNCVVATLPLSGRSLLLGYMALFIPIFLGLVLPLVQLISWASYTWRHALRLDYWQLTGHTLLLSFLAVLCCLILATLMVYARKILPKNGLSVLSRLAFLGYAIPGAVIALAVMQITGTLDNWLTGGTSLFFSASLASLIYAYVVRYIPLAQRAISGVLEERYVRIDEAARSLGHRPLSALLQIHCPNLRPIFLGAATLCFLDIIRELPLTMILRPFNFSTLAVQTFELAANEQVPEAAVPALTIVLISTFCVLALQGRWGKKWMAK